MSQTKLYRCDSCEFEADDGDAIQPWWEADGLAERLDVGCPVPYGVCPECMALVYRHDREKLLHDAAPDLLEALKAFLRAPSIGSSGPGSVTIEVQEFNLREAEAAIAKAEGSAQ